MSPRIYLIVAMLMLAIRVAHSQTASASESPSVAAAREAAAGQAAGQPWVSGGFPASAPAPAPAQFPASNYGPGQYGATGASSAPPPPPVAQAGAGQASVPPLVPAPTLRQAQEMVSPLTPSEIRELHQDFVATRQAKAQRPIETVPHISAVSVDLSPGASPPIARTMPGETTTLVFLDATGAPWPLAAQPLHSNNNFEVMWLKDSPDVVIAAHSMFEGANLTVFLVGLPAPVVVKLSSGEPDSTATRRDVDYRLDLRVPGRGPNARPTTGGEGQIALYDDVLQAMLDGSPPSEAKPVEIMGDQPMRTQVWQLGDALYVRTPLAIESAYEQTMASADGMHIYKLALTPIVTLASGGQSLPLTLAIN